MNMDVVMEALGIMGKGMLGISKSLPGKSPDKGKREGRALAARLFLFFGK